MDCRKIKRAISIAKAKLDAASAALDNGDSTTSRAQLRRARTLMLICINAQFDLLPGAVRVAETQLEGVLARDDDASRELEAILSDGDEGPRRMHPALSAVDLSVPTMRVSLSGDRYLEARFIVEGEEIVVKAGGCTLDVERYDSGNLALRTRREPS